MIRLYYAVFVFGKEQVLQLLKYTGNNYISLFIFQEEYLKGKWSGYSQAPNAITTWNTGVETDLLEYIGQKSVSVPENFVGRRHCLFI